MTDTLQDIEKLEADLWEAADNLRANSKLTSSDYFMPVLGMIFLRHAANRFEAATRQIEADQAAGRMPRRNLFPAITCVAVPCGYQKRRATAGSCSRSPGWSMWRHAASSSAPFGASSTTNSGS